MPRTPKQLEEMRSRTRSRILDAATRVFSRRGFGAASMQDIAQEAGVSVGLIYRHFSTKEDLFGTLLHQAAEGLAEVGKLFASPLPADQLFLLFTEEVVNDLENNDDFAAFMVLVTQAFMTEDFVPEVRELNKQNKLLFDRVAQVIERGQQSGVFKPGNPAAMTQYFFSSIQGLAGLKFTLRKRFVPPSTDMLLRFLIKEG